ncbi:MAG: hypothetical protein RR086_05460, partial [Clostridia bacterium]
YNLVAPGFVLNGVPDYGNKKDYAIKEIVAASKIANECQLNKGDAGYNVNNNNGSFFTDVRLGAKMHETVQGRTDVETLGNIAIDVASVAIDVLFPYAKRINDIVTVAGTMDNAVTVMNSTFPTQTTATLNISPDGKLVLSGEEIFANSKARQITQYGDLKTAALGNVKENGKYYLVGDKFICSFRIGETDDIKTRIEQSLCIGVGKLGESAKDKIGSGTNNFFLDGTGVVNVISTGTTSSKIFPQGENLFSFTPIASGYYTLSTDNALTVVTSVINIATGESVTAVSGKYYLDKGTSYRLKINSNEPCNASNLFSSLFYNLSINIYTESISLSEGRSVTIQAQKSYYCSFTPTVSGVYNFHADGNAQIEVGFGDFVADYSVEGTNPAFNYFFVAGTQYILRVTNKQADRQVSLAVSETTNITDGQSVLAYDGGSVRYYEFAPKKSGTYLFEVIGTIYVPIQVFNENKTVVSVFDSYGSSYSISANLNANGIYYILVGNNGSGGTLNINCVWRPLLAQDFSATFDQTTFIFSLSYTGADSINSLEITGYTLSIKGMETYNTSGQNFTGSLSWNIGDVPTEAGFFVVWGVKYVRENVTREYIGELSISDYTLTMSESNNWNNGGFTRLYINDGYGNNQTTSVTQLP